MRIIKPPMKYLILIIACLCLMTFTLVYKDKLYKTFRDIALDYPAYVTQKPSVAGTFSATSSPSPSPHLSSYPTITTVLPKAKNIDANFSFPILYYHSINDKPIGIPELSVTVSEFQNQMEYLYQNNYTPIGFDEIDNMGSFSKPIIITFDDGYSDNYYNAYPILNKFKFKATVFIPSDFINKSNMISSSMIKEMSDLVDFQNHTVSHVDLTSLTEEHIIKDFENSNKTLSEITGKPVYVIAYPFGKYNSVVTKVSSNYFKFGVTINSGLFDNDNNHLEIKRIYVPRGTTIDKFKTRLKYGMLK